MGKNDTIEDVIVRASKRSVPKFASTRVESNDPVAQEFGMTSRENGKSKAAFPFLTFQRAGRKTRVNRKVQI
jgi:hypothetical protein